MAAAFIVAAVTVLLVSPWLAWMLLSGGDRGTQANLLLEAGSGLPARAVSQGIFLVRRIPDQITGPLVEIATVIRPGSGLAGIANLWAVTSSTVVIGGLVIAALRRAAGWPA